MRMWGFLKKLRELPRLGYVPFLDESEFTIADGGLRMPFFVKEAIKFRSPRSGLVLHPLQAVLEATCNVSPEFNQGELIKSAEGCLNMSARLSKKLFLAPYGSPFSSKFCYRRMKRMLGL
jgi:hypothetical protein